MTQDTSPAYLISQPLISRHGQSVERSRDHIRDEEGDQQRGHDDV
jgi:hypothetical protein